MATANSGLNSKNSKKESCGVLEKIVVVEDSEEYRETLISAIKTRFPSVAITGVGSAEEFIEKFDDFQTNLIIADIRLPGMSGLELTKKVKKDHPDISIIIMTAYDMLEYRQQAREYQAEDFINKNSTSLDEIISIVEKYIVRPRNSSHTGVPHSD